jgi:sugar lactone lactonase YvrE
MFVANTAFHQIIQIPGNSDGSAGTPSIFITGINAPDGIRIDRDDNIWICANQEDEIVVIDKTGKVIAKLGEFGASMRTASCAGFCSRRAWPLALARTARPSTSPT